MQARDDPEGRTAAAGAPPPLERQGLVNPQRPQALNQRTPTSLLRTSTPIVAGEDDRPDRDIGTTYERQSTGYAYALTRGARGISAID